MKAASGFCRFALLSFVSFFFTAVTTFVALADVSEDFDFFVFFVEPVALMRVTESFDELGLATVFSQFKKSATCRLSIPTVRYLVVKCNLLIEFRERKAKGRAVVQATFDVNRAV